MFKQKAQLILLCCVGLWGCPGTLGGASPDGAPKAQTACASAQADPWSAAQQWVLTTAAQGLPEGAPRELMASWPAGEGKLLRVWRAQDGRFYALVGEQAEQAKGQALLLELGAAAPFTVSQISVAQATALWPAVGE